MHRKVAGTFLVAVAILVSGCSSPSTSETGVSPDGADAKVVSTGTNYDSGSYEVTTGGVLSYENDDNNFHNVVIEDQDFTLDVRPGDMAAQVVDLPPGRYVFYCSVPGHRQSGMEADLVVTK